MSSDRTKIAQFSIFSFTDFEPCFEASAVKATQPILVHANSPSSWFWNFLLYSGSMTSLCVALTSSLLRSSWRRGRHAWRWEFQRNVFCTSGIQELWSKFCPLEGSFCSCKWTLFSDVLTWDCCCRRRCCFSMEAGFLLHRGGIGFPKHARRFDLRFNVVRIFWTLPVIFHGGLGRFETHIIDVLFLFAQRWTVIHNPRLFRIHVGHSRALSDGTGTGRWFEFVLATFHWCRSPTILIMIVPVP